jgi:amino acid adenylation domain-containing protein
MGRDHELKASDELLAMSQALWTGFLRSAERVPNHPALVVAGQTFTYTELRELALRIAATIQSRAPSSTPPLTAVFAYRSPTAFAGILGSLAAGHGYVPLNRTFPTVRTQRMLQSSECRSLVADESSLAQLDELLEAAEHPMLVLVPDADDATQLQGRWEQHMFVGADGLEPAASWRVPEVAPDAIAYLLFTSGSTGIPKGVIVSHRNVRAFVDFMVDRYQVEEDDRFSQMFDMTFDLSVFDMFVCWERGACLCCPTQKDLVSPGKFLREARLTIWFSVPSTAVFMRRLGLLKPDRYPSLRLSLFCGEPLPVSIATAWLEAAPNSVVENLYGPTELTIACTFYRWEPRTSPQESELDVVPIGRPYPGMRPLVVDDDFNEVGPGQPGELLMAGPQMSLGYWKDPEKTAAAFVMPPGHDELYYRTGDRVRRPLGDGPLTHLGRTDSQIKIRGHRVELGEIEAVVRRVSGFDGVIAIAWPATSSGYDAVEAFIEGGTADVSALRSAIAAELPEYMVPRRIHFLKRLPRNLNDKFDRAVMAKMLEEGL